VATLPVLRLTGSTERGPGQAGRVGSLRSRFSEKIGDKANAKGYKELTSFTREIIARWIH